MPVCSQDSTVSRPSTSNGGSVKRAASRKVGDSVYNVVRSLRLILRKTLLCIKTPAKKSMHYRHSEDNYRFDDSYWI